MRHNDLMALQWFAEDPQPADPKPGDPGDSKPGRDETDPQPDPKSVPKYTDEDLDRIFDKKFKKLMDQHEKDLEEARRLTEMNAQERAEHENKKLQEQVQELLRKEAIAEMKKSARAMLGEKNINVGDDLLELLVAEDADKTKKSVENFISLFESAVNKAVKDALKGEPPKAGGSSGLTREQIMKVANRAERQKLIKENMHLFQ